MWQPRPRVRRALAAVTGFAVLYGLWLLLVESLAVPELLAGVPVAVLGVIAATTALQHEQRFIPALAAEAQRILRLPPAMVRDSVLVLGAALYAGMRRRRLAGAFREVPYRVGGDDPDAAGRRAVAIALQSFAPNTCVLGFDEQRDVMVVHQLVRTGATRSRRTTPRQ